MEPAGLPPGSDSRGAETRAAETRATATRVASGEPEAGELDALVDDCLVLVLQALERPADWRAAGLVCRRLARLAAATPQVRVEVRTADDARRAACCPGLRAARFVAGCPAVAIPLARSLTGLDVSSWAVAARLDEQLGPPSGPPPGPPSDPPPGPPSDPLSSPPPGTGLALRSFRLDLDDRPVPGRLEWAARAALERFEASDAPPGWLAALGASQGATLERLAIGPPMLAPMGCWTIRRLDVAALPGLAALRCLELRLVAFNDLGPVGRLPRLERLSLYRCAWGGACVGPAGACVGPAGARASVAPLAGLAALRDLEIVGQAIGDEGGLAGLALARLALPGCQLRSLAFVARMPLRDLDLRGAEVAQRDLAPLAGAPVSPAGAPVSPAGAPVSPAATLGRLVLGGGHWQLRALAACRQLRALDVAGAGVRHFGWLADQPALEWLAVRLTGRGRSSSPAVFTRLPALRTLVVALDGAPGGEWPAAWDDALAALAARGVLVVAAPAGWPLGRPP